MNTKRLTAEQKERMTDAIASFGRKFRVIGGSIVEYDGKKILNFGLSEHDVSRANVKAMAKKIDEAGIFEEEFNEIHYGGVCVWSAI